MKAFLSQTLALLLVLLLLGPASSASSILRDDNRSARREVRAYIEQNVLPVIRQQRQKLEAQLATSDKAQLAIYRSQLKEIRQRRQALRQSFRAGQPTPQATEPASPGVALTEAQQQQLEQLRSETKAVMTSVSEMAQRYATNIAQLTQEIQPQKEKWATDIQELLVKSASPEQQKVGRFKGGLHHRAGAARLLRPAAFLLLDPKAPVATPTPEAGSTGVYPNPAVASSKLDYTVAKAGPVTIELLDGRGNTLRTVAQEPKQEKGPHTLQVNLADLTAGTYYYKITTRAGSETKRFVKE